MDVWKHSSPPRSAHQCHVNDEHKKINRSGFFSRWCPGRAPGIGPCVKRSFLGNWPHSRKTSIILREYFQLKWDKYTVTKKTPTTHHPPTITTNLGHSPSEELGGLREEIGRGRRTCGCFGINSFKICAFSAFVSWIWLEGLHVHNGGGFHFQGENVWRNRL